MELTKCPKCGLPFRYGTEQVGIDNNGIPIYNRFGYCDICKSKYNIDAINCTVPVQNTNSKYNESAEKPKKKTSFRFGIVVLILFIIYAILPKNENDESEESHNNLDGIVAEKSDSKNENLSAKELFSKTMSDSSQYISFDNAEKIYSFIENDLGFEKINFDGKNTVGDILFDITADNYYLMISADNDGIYSIRCGSYELYNGKEVLMTKTGLDDRNIGSKKSSYYVIAEEIIKNNLKSPSTANFPSLWSDEIKMQRNGDMVVVQGYVDAQNSFGTTIRSQWLVEFRVIDLDNYSYETIYINIDGTKIGEFIELD